MAWHKSLMNARSEPTYIGQRPTISDADGGKYSISEYMESHSSERYEAKTEQTFQFRGPLGMTDYERSSPRKDMYKEHGMDGRPLLVPWGLGREWPEKGNGISPKFRQEALRAQDNGSPRKDIYKSHSPTARDHEYGKYNYFKNKDEYETDDDDDDHDHECVENTKEGSNKQSFIKENGQTHPRKQTYSFDDLDLDLEKEKRKSHAPNYTSNNYIPPCPSLNYPKQETRYEKAPTYYNEKRKEKGSDDYTPPYTVPAPVIPRKETYNRPMVMPNPPPIRTRVDRGKDAEYYNEGKNSPHFNSPNYNSPNYNSPSSRKDHQGFGEGLDYTSSKSPCPLLNYPKQETHYEKAPTYYNEKRKEKGSDDHTPPYTVPTTVIPREETYNWLVGKDAEYYNEVKNYSHFNSPNYNSPNYKPSSRKNHQGFVYREKGTSEVYREKGTSPPRKVDSKEAARRYRAVLLTSSRDL